MFSSNRLHKDESGQTALETAIILIAFVVVASVFAFTILSAGQASTEKGQQAIYSGLEGVQSSMQVKGSVIADGETDAVTNVIFTVQLAAGGAPVDLDPDTGQVVIGYRDGTQAVNDVDYTAAFIVEKGTANTMLEAQELAEITVPLEALTPTSPSGGTWTDLGPNTPFTLEIKPPTGSVITINRTTPAAITAVMELH